MKMFKMWHGEGIFYSHEDVMSIVLNYVVNFNESGKGGCTSVEMISGERFVVFCEYKQFRTVMHNFIDDYNK